MAEAAFEKIKAAIRLLRAVALSAEEKKERQRSQRLFLPNALAAPAHERGAAARGKERHIGTHEKSCLLYILAYAEMAEKRAKHSSGIGRASP